LGSRPTHSPSFRPFFRGPWRRDHGTLQFLSINDLNNAVDKLSYYASEHIRGEGAIYELGGVPWIHAYALERGDLVKVTPPWETTAKTCRVVGYVRRFDDEMADLVLVEIVFGV
jgi:hypothetical protein